MQIGRVVAVITASLAIAATATGITYAATSSSGGSVHACANAKGILRLLDADGHCPKHYAKVSINERGPRGATGKTGPRGKPGAPGESGASGAPGPGAVGLSVKATTSGAVTKESQPIDGTELTVEVVCVPQQWAQVYINLDYPGSQFSFEGTGSFSAAGGAGHASWLNEAGDAVVTTPLTTLTPLAAAQPGSQHSVEFTTTGGTLVADVLVTQDGHTFSVQLSESRDSSNTCWSDALVTPAG